MMKKAVPVTVLFLAVLFSCTTVQFAYKESTAEKVIDLINSGDAETLAAVSGSPFLLDGEIIMLPGDMKLFWEKASENGLELIAPEVTGVDPVDGTAWKRFSPYEDVKIFFEKYVPADAALVRVTTSSGEVLLILQGKSGGYPYILGIKGI